MKVTGQEPIGRRVREAMLAAFGASRTQAAIAGDVGMTPDAFSRSLKGERAFSSSELARVAHLCHADLHYLITGEPDPLRAVFAARHGFDPERLTHVNPGTAADEPIRDGVILAYRQASRWLTPSTVTLPSTPSKVRALLGEDFPLSFANRVEERLGVDVMRLPSLSTDYSLRIAEQRIILLKAEPNWFRSNWSLAHEIAHLSLDHHAVDADEVDATVEAAANAFAAELLLPATRVRALRWDTFTVADVAGLIWETGVSTSVLRNRLQNVGVAVPAVIAQCLQQSTQALLNRNPTPATVAQKVDNPQHVFATVVDPIGERMSRANERRIPTRLVKALRDGIEAGELNNGTLAWLYGVDQEDLDPEEPDAAPELGVDDLADLLGI